MMSLFFLEEKEKTINIVAMLLINFVKRVNFILEKNIFKLFF